MGFSDIIGHKDITQALDLSVHDARTGHAYLFVGPAGIGKKTLAKAFAGRLLCTDRTAVSDCDCASCRRYKLNSHPDFMTVIPSGNSIKIEQMRELQRNAYLRPLMGECKVFFFPEAEQLTEAAANSILKLLEEPPFKTVFLFAAQRADLILPTIRSRCQVYNLFPVPAEEIAKWLLEKGYSEAEATRRSIAVKGLPGRALDMEEVAAGEVRIDFPRIMEENLLRLFQIAGEFEKKDRREVLAVLQEWQSQIEDHLLQLGKSSPVGLTVGKVGDWVYISEKLTQVMMMIESNVNQRLGLDEFFISLKVRAGSNVS